MNTTATTCRCGAATEVACVDLVENLCRPCWEHFDAWADAHRYSLFRDWPGRTA